MKRARIVRQVRSQRLLGVPHVSHSLLDLLSDHPSEALTWKQPFSICEFAWQQVCDATADVAVEGGVLRVAVDDPGEHKQMLGIRMHRRLFAISPNFNTYFRVIIGLHNLEVVFEGLPNIRNISEVRSEEADLLGGGIEAGEGQGA